MLWQGSPWPHVLCLTLRPLVLERDRVPVVVNTMLERIQNTERHILTSAGATVDYGDYLVARSSRYPKWYQANMMELRVSGGRSLSDWEQLFHSHFDRTSYQHLMLYIPARKGFEALCDEVDEMTSADQLGAPPLVVERIVWMFANESRKTALPEGMEVCRVELEDDYRDLIEFGVEESTEEPWFTNRDEVRAYIRSRREVTDRIGVRWYRLSHCGDRRILARLGIFEYQGICRLQAVGTLKSFRGRGLGSALVNYAIGEALRRGSSGLALSAEADSVAQSMYLKAEFREVGTDMWLMRYPGSA